MIVLDDQHLMMIEPKKKATAPIADELTAIAGEVFKTTKPSASRYRGFHVCVCGVRSDNRDWILPDGRITNSLMVHYVCCHREEVPESEIKKLREYQS